MLLPFHTAGILEAGVDEAGRGCYAGAVFASAVILPPDCFHPLLNDSKKVKAENRYILRNFIQINALAWAVGTASPEEIDAINILQAALLAMHRAIEQLQIPPAFLLIDGNRFKPYATLPHQCFVHGDATFASIAAASILAKTYRDDYMLQLNEEFPQYGWHQNKGYGTAIHRKAIAEYGLCKYHRQSFKIA